MEPENTSQHTFNFFYENVQPVEENISYVNCPYVMGDESSSSNSLNCIFYGQSDGPMQNANDIARFPFQYICPCTNFNGEVEQEMVVAFGETKEPLAAWMRKITQNDCWEYFTNGSLKGLNSEARRVGRWMGAAMHKRHLEWKYLGNFLKTTLVGRNGIEFTNLANDYPNLVEGIKKDIRDFKSFVQAFLARRPFRSNHTKAHHRAIYDLAVDLCEAADQLQTVEQLENLSYFVSHTPLFWETSQRIDFCHAFERIYSKDTKVFHANIKNLYCDKSHYRMDWDQVIAQHQNQRYIEVLKSQSHRYKKRLGLMRYHGDCQIHLRDNETRPPFTTKESIDECLRTYFPDIIPKTWYGLYHGLLSHKEDLIEELKCQPGDLNYNR